MFIVIAVFIANDTIIAHTACPPPWGAGDRRRRWWGACNDNDVYDSYHRALLRILFFAAPDDIFTDNLSRCAGAYAVGGDGFVH